ncbi:MAG: glycosyltransferase [Chthoniobacteraceae bacterium]
MLAYACDPDGSGEHWLGWGWAEQAAQAFDVHLFTPVKARAAIEKRAGHLGITPHFVEISPRLRWWSERFGQAGLWWRKIVWARLAASAVGLQHARASFAVVHHTTFHTFRVPFYAASLGIPAVWGPIAGGERAPSGFKKYLGSARWPEAWRIISNRLWLQWPAVQRALQDARILFLSNAITRDFLPESCRGKCELVPANALRPEDQEIEIDRTRNRTAPVSLLYVGNCVARRSIPLVLEALKTTTAPCRLIVVGDGPAFKEWRQCAADLGLEDRVEFRGQVPRTDLPALYAAADALVFPALRDSGGSALLEAMSKGLCVICLDWGGPGEIVDDESGIKVSAASPAAAIAGFAEAFQRLHSDPTLRVRIGHAAAIRAREKFSWAEKRRLLESAYRRLISAS